MRAGTHRISPRELCRYFELTGVWMQFTTGSGFTLRSRWMGVLELDWLLRGVPDADSRSGLTCSHLAEWQILLPAKVHRRVARSSGLSRAVAPISAIPDTHAVEIMRAEIVEYRPSATAIFIPAPRANIATVSSAVCASLAPATTFSGPRPPQRPRQNRPAEAQHDDFDYHDDHSPRRVRGREPLSCTACVKFSPMWND
jgi:hypothetical protein